MVQKMLIAALFLALPVSAAALDKEAVGSHLQEAYEIPAQVKIELGDPKPSKVPGFQELEVLFKVGGRTQADKLFISDDGRFYILGGFQDVRVSPSQRRVDVMNIRKSAFRGPRKAPVQVVEYTDFECVFCKRGFEMMRDRIMKDYPKKVRWIYKSMPLVAIHPWARPAAVAAECANLQGHDQFWKLHDALFERQRQINIANFDEELAKIVDEAGINKKRFDSCYDKQATASVVDSDMAEASQLGISGTPAFVVNGFRIKGADYEGLKNAVDNALKGKYGKIKP